MINFLFVLLFSFWSVFYGRPASNTEVYLDKGGQLIAFQATGEKGKVHFKYLDQGSYQLSLVFPQQEGKYIKEKTRHESMTKATYNAKNRVYYYQGSEGFFAIKFTGISGIKSQNFAAIFKEEREEEDKYNVIAEFGIHKNGGSIGVFVEAITAAQFKKAADKIGQDISTQSIRGIK
ncbi:hypothetical protein [uncultured Draconibacterium sp.]|uniref:hypothetical protein n=1 Tax=uncultured Draconibacterium sp. TaxID=1573823 RepID=UPI0032604BE3